jgi:transcriptional regulator with XRE-family HTH domain
MTIDPRIAPFANDRLAKDERRALLSERFVSAATMIDPGNVAPGWLAALVSGVDDDVDLLGRIMRDIARHDQGDARTFGPKAATLDPRRTREMLRQFAGDDHTLLPFAEAFRLMAGERSYRHLAARIGMSKDKVSRLLRGRPPTPHEMEQIARAFNKHPSFFREYRDSHLVDQLRRRLDDLPEASVDMYRQSVSSNR